MGGRKKAFYIISFIVLAISGYFLVKASLPKEASRYPVFVVLFLLDIYLWISIRKKIYKQKPSIKYFISVLYWSPLLLVACLFIGSLFQPLKLWDSGFRTYAFGIVFIAYASKLFTVLFLFMADLLNMAKHLYRFSSQKKQKTAKFEGTKISRSKFLVNLGLLGGGFIFSGLLIGMVKWANDFKIRYVKVPLANLPSSFNGFKVVQISDLHLGSWASKEPLKDIVKIINGLSADIVVFTGDLVNFSTAEAFGFESILKEIKAKYGVFAILGNHDYGTYVNWDSIKEKEKNMQDMFDLYERIGWKLLNNENSIIEIDGQELAIIGVENWSAHHRFPKHGNLEKAMYGSSDVAAKILLSHDPSHWENVIRRKYPEIGLTLSGHTHGFQFGIETANFKWSPAQYLYKQWAGLYQNDQNQQFIYVNRGTGFIGYPGRIGILPEITELILHQA
jgi:uncharacterized protein